MSKKEISWNMIILARDGSQTRYWGQTNRNRHMQHWPVVRAICGGGFGPNQREAPYVTALNFLNKIQKYNPLVIWDKE